MTATGFARVLTGEQHVSVYLLQGRAKWVVLFGVFRWLSDRSVPSQPDHTQPRLRHDGIDAVSAEAMQ